jgi:glycosyltransferase involved in cell wall biosynthesis
VNGAPRVSCVMIFLDGERFIDEAIRSIVDQTYPSWELLLVDDGSSDGSTAIAREWAERDSRIRYLEHDDHENRGMSASRNLGVASARGEFVTFLDCDDVALPQKFATQVAALDADPSVDATYGPTWIWHGWTGRPEDVRYDGAKPTGIAGTQVVDPPRLMHLYRDSDGAAVPSVCSIMVRRSSLESLGGFEESFRGLYEDQVFYAKLALHLRVLVTEEVLERYRMHPDSTCALATRDLTYHPQLLHPSERTYLEWLEGYVVASGFGADVVDRVRAGLAPYRNPFHPRARRDRRQRTYLQVKRRARRAMPASAWRLLKAAAGRPEQVVAEDLRT